MTSNFISNLGDQVSKSTQEVQIPSHSFNNNFSDVRSTIEKQLDDDMKSNRSKSADAVSRID